MTPSCREGRSIRRHLKKRTPELGTWMPGWPRAPQFAHRLRIMMHAGRSPWDRAISLCEEQDLQFPVPATHAEHSEKRPTGKPGSMVLLAV